MEELFKESKEFKILFKKSQNLLMGKYSSKLKGEGLEFADLKDYNPGDDVRKIDWKVTARQNRPFVKEFLEERDANHYVLLDVSGSGFNKIEKMKILASSLIYSSYLKQDAFGIIFFAKNLLLPINLSKGKKHLMRCIYEISKIDCKKEGDFMSALKFVLSRVKSKSIISIISDEFEKQKIDLKLLSGISKKHKLLYFQVFNSKEKEVEEGISSYEDVESGLEMIYDLSQEEIKKFHRFYDDKISNYKNNLQRGGIKVYSLDCKYENMITLFMKENEVL